MAEGLTPMMQQYQRLRKSIPPDTFLLFRLGDFYELFFEDAKEASSLLNVALTRRNGVPMCGVPYHAAPAYIAKLIKAGRRVAVCDQTSEAQPGKIVSRDITQVITAGTVSELNLLEANKANYLGAVYASDGLFGFAYADLTTGEFRLMQAADHQSLLDALVRVGPAELLVSEEQREQFAALENATSYDSYAFLPDQSSFVLCEHFKTKSLDGFGCADMPAAIGAAGSIVHYLKHQLRRKVNQLKIIRDCERAAGRLSQASGNARDLVSLRVSLEQLPKLRAEIRKLKERVEYGTGAKEAGDPTAATNGAHRKMIDRIHEGIHEMPEVAAKLAGALADEPPLALKEGGIFRDGHNADLDELRSAAREGKNWIGELQEREIAATGIKSLKVRFNSVFGYFIEITKSNLAEVPQHYTRKQTTVGGERFITPELKDIEGKILGAEERSRNLEYQLFQQLRDETLREIQFIQETASAIANLDAITSLAETARLFHYCRPQLDESLRLSIRDGRHPVLDQRLIEEKFVPNDTELDGEKERLAIITGPNMAGKSTYIRQVALIVLMAQMGSFVPATSAQIGLVDRIFTRVGANDDLSRGQSTFMIEMNETANIVNNATARSLVILDEIGRGTSTFDGLSIAWSVAEFLHDTIKARTLFATHYHELTKLAEQRKGICNLNVAVREWNDQIIFLRKIVSGGADKSYGIQVARLAGLPKELLDREILAHMEQPDTSASQTGKPRKKTKSGMPTAEKPQLDLL